MAATVARNASFQTVVGDLRVAQADVTFDTSYPTGGLAVTAAQLGLTNVYAAVAQVKTAGVGSVTAVSYDVANAKLLAFTAAAQVANATDLSAVSATVTAFGK